MIHSPVKRHTIKFLKYLIDNGFITKRGVEYSEEEVRQEYASRVDASASKMLVARVRQRNNSLGLGPGNPDNPMPQFACEAPEDKWGFYSDAAISFDPEEIEREMFPLQAMKPVSLCSILRRESPVWILTA